MRPLGLLAAFMIAAGCAPAARPIDPCAGANQCVAGGFQHCVDGELVVDSCGAACDDVLGCVSCEPGTATCDGDVAHVCVNGTMVDQVCDPVQGVTCDETGGGCVGACAPDQIGRSYIGCDYYPTITGNMVSNAYSFAVAISNTTMAAARVTLEGGALPAPDVFEVGPGQVVTRTLPWRVDLKLCSAPHWNECLALATTSVLATNGAYRLRSTQPVTVYQFNPLDFFLAAAPENSYTNDASLLLPANAWRDEYVVAGWGGMTTNPALVAVTASEPDTMVTIQSTAPVKGELGAPAIDAGGSATVELARGDVLQLGTAMVDFTGTRITANRPIQVISAHYCANVPDFFGDCDHLEESMFPIATLGARYLITTPALPTLPDGKEQLVRIVATADQTTLSFDPPQPGVATQLARAGDFIEVPRRVANYQITANHKVLVAQFMLGQQVAGNTGDPSMALAVPIEQFRDHYQFHAPTNYETNYIDVVAPLATQILLDGAPLPPLRAIGNSGWGTARVEHLAGGPGNDGNHAIAGSQPFGITVYGYGEFTSYWYPGGLDLKDVLE